MYDMHDVLQNIRNGEEKETTLNYYSEKSAMAFGLISTARSRSSNQNGEES